MMEGISLLMFKPGFSIQDVPAGLELNYYSKRHHILINILAIDEHMVWKSGVTVPEATNHHVHSYNGVRIQLLRLLIVVLSQPLFYGPDEYLLILNPFSTYFTSRRAKNTKNLFVSLVNTVLAYDTQGYVSDKFELNFLNLGHSIPKRNRFLRRPRNLDYIVSSSTFNLDRVQASFL
jgi:hypothetical protein